MLNIKINATNGELIEEKTEARTPAETIGKVIEFGAELAVPIGKSKLSQIDLPGIQNFRLRGNLSTG